MRRTSYVARKVSYEPVAGFLMVGARYAAAVGVVVVIAATVPAVAVGPVSPAKPTPISRGEALSSAHPVLRFGGQMRNPTPLPAVSDPDPTLCAADCDLWSLRVDTRHPFLISIRNANSSVDDGFDLTVYDPSGRAVGTADGIGADGQAIAVTPSSAGTYTVAVTMTYAYDATAAYLGEARIMAAPTWRVPRCASRACPVLPALRVQAPADVHIDGIPPVASTPLGFPFPVDASTGSSCYADETAGTGATRCLRFTSEIDNVGLGLLTLRVPWMTKGSAAPQVGMVPGGCHAEQGIRLTDGTTRWRSAGPCEWHAEHGHFHYRDFVEFSLHRVTRSGATGATVARSLKESFCLADDGYIGFATPGPNGPRTYAGQPGCNVPAPPGGAASDLWVTMGITPGWGDIYTWDTPDQYIDVAHTPPGVYDIVSRANPAGLLVLAGPRRPCATTRIRLTPTKVTVIERGIRCV